MPQKNLKTRRCRRPRQAGQAMVESALVLLVFLMTLVAVIDFGQLMFTHQMMVERARAGLRYGMINAWDGTGDAIANVILYNKAHPNPTPTVSTFGLKRANIVVTRTAGTTADPNDVRLKVSIVNYKFKFLTPFIAKSFTNNYAVVQSAPLMYRN